MNKTHFIRESKESDEIELLDSEDAKFRTSQFKDSIERMMRGETLETEFNKFYKSNI